MVYGKLYSVAKWKKTWTVDVINIWESVKDNRKNMFSAADRDDALC